MSVSIRCIKCERYYALKHNKCPACGFENRDKSYYVRFGGKITFAGNSLKLAREMDAKIKMDARLGNIDVYAKPKHMTFGEFVEKHYEPHYMSRNKSADKMKCWVNYFNSIFKDKVMKSITPADIEEAVTTRTVGRKPRTRDHYLAIIRRIFNYAVELELLERSPVKMKELKVDNTRHRFLSDKESLRLLD